MTNEIYVFFDFVQGLIQNHLIAQNICTADFERNTMEIILIALLIASLVFQAANSVSTMNRTEF